MSAKQSNVFINLGWRKIHENTHKCYAFFHISFQRNFASNKSKYLPKTTAQWLIKEGKRTRQKLVYFK